MAPRHFVPLGLLAVVAAPSCVSTLGLNEEYRSAAKQLCFCDEVNVLYGGDAQECAADVEKNLARVTESTRADWMEKFTSTCTACPAAAACFFTPPTCALTGPCPDTDKCERCCAQPSTGTCA